MQSSEVIQAVEKYVRTCGCDYSRWVVGLAADPVEHLLGYHGVAEEGDGCGWITYQCASADEALAARVHFTGLGMKDAAGGGDDGTTTSPPTSIYAFRITSATRW